MNPQVAVMSAAREEILPKKFDTMEIETNPISSNVKHLTVTGIGRAYASELIEDVETKKTFELQKFSAQPSNENN